MCRWRVVVMVTSDWLSVRVSERRGQWICLYACLRVSGQAVDLKMRGKEIEVVLVECSKRVHPSSPNFHFVDLRSKQLLQRSAANWY